MLGIRRRKQKNKKHQPKEKKHLAISHKMDKPIASMLEMIAQPPLLKQAKKATKKPKMPQKQRKQKETKLLMATVATAGHG